MESDLSVVESLLRDIYTELTQIHSILETQLDSKNEGSFAKELITAVEWVDNSITSLRKP